MDVLKKSETLTASAKYYVCESMLKIEAMSDYLKKEKSPKECRAYSKLDNRLLLEHENCR